MSLDSQPGGVDSPHGYQTQAYGSQASYGSSQQGYYGAQAMGMPLSQGDDRGGLSLSQDSSAQGFAFSAASQEDYGRYAGLSEMWSAPPDAFETQASYNSQPPTQSQSSQRGA